MSKKILLLAIIILTACSPESTEQTEATASTTPEATASPTPKPTPNPTLSAKQRDLVIQMHKEASMLKKLYEEAFNAKDEELYRTAKGIGYALVRRDEKDPQIMKHPGIACYSAFMALNGSYDGMAWRDLKEEGQLSDDSKESLIQAQQDLAECEKSAKETGILNDENMAKPLPSITPIEVVI